jgi:hypothetical protein
VDQILKEHQDTEEWLRTESSEKENNDYFEIDHSPRKSDLIRNEIESDALECIV